MVMIDFSLWFNLSMVNYRRIIISTGLHPVFLGRLDIPEHFWITWRFGSKSYGFYMRSHLVAMIGGKP